MKKRILVKKEQLIEYVERKKSEKIFHEIVEKLHDNRKLLKESVSYGSINQDIINDYRRKNLINSTIFEMLVKHNIMNRNYEII